MTVSGRTGGQSSRSVLIAAAPLILLLAALLPLAWHFLARSAEAIRTPAGLDYGEGIVWQQMIGFLQGTGYGPMQGIPAIIYHYPPIYYLATAVIEPLARDALQAGRIVSIAATLGTAWVVGLTSLRLCGSKDYRAVQLLCAILAGLFYLHYAPVARWSVLMRVDPLAMFFAMAALLATIEALRRPKLIYLSGVLFFLAVFTRQSQILAPAAVYGTLLFIRPGLALRGGLTAAAFALVSLGALMVSTDGMFLQHVVAANINRYDPQLLIGLFFTALLFDVLSLLFSAAVGARILMRLRRREAWTADTSDESAALAMVMAYAIVMAGSLLMVAKSGASINYWMPFLSAVSVLLGIGLFRCFCRAHAALEQQGTRSHILVLVIPVMLTVFPIASAAKPPPVSNRDNEIVEQELMEVASSCPGWVISDNMVALLRAGKPVVWEPAIFAELGTLGRYDERPVIDAIRTHRVCAVMVRDSAMAVRYTPSVRQAIEQGLPNKRSFDGWTVYQAR